VSRGGADQGGEEADGLGRFLGSKRHEVGLCQLDLLIHVIPGRLSLASPAFGPDLRFDLIEIVLRRTPRFLYVFTTGTGPCWYTVPGHSSHRVPAQSRGVRGGGSHGVRLPRPDWYPGRVDRRRHGTPRRLAELPRVLPGIPASSPSSLVLQARPGDASVPCRCSRGETSISGTVPAEFRSVPSSHPVPAGFQRGPTLGGRGRCAPIGRMMFDNPATTRGRQASPHGVMSRSWLVRGPGLRGCS
jgi:hypothetical protein